MRYVRRRRGSGSGARYDARFLLVKLPRGRWAVVYPVKHALVDRSIQMMLEPLLVRETSCSAAV